MKKLSSSSSSLLNAEYYSDEIRKFTIRDTNSQFHSIYFKKFEKCYEADVTAALEIFLDKDSVFIDIGSNWGHHSFYAALERGSNVIAFEPNLDICNDLIRIKKELSLDDKIHAYNFALSSREASLNLRQHYFDSGVASIDRAYSNAISSTNKALNIIKKISGMHSIEQRVAVRTLDSFALEKATLIKVDAEGLELDIMRGGVNTIIKNNPVIVFEYYFNSIEGLLSYTNFFDTLNYSIYQVTCNNLSEFYFNFDYQLSKLNVAKLIKFNQYNLVAMSNLRYEELSAV
jgi:FkbM family methyltransferase